MNTTDRILVKIFQQLPDFKGKRRLAKLLLKQLIASTKDLTIKGTDSLEYKLPNLVETVGFEILINGIYEKDTSDFIISQVPKDGSLLDIGANIGAVTIPVLHKRKDITAVSVEASPRIYRYLETNVRQNDLTGVTLVNKAVTATDGLKVNFFSPENNYGKGSLSASFTDKAEEVETITLDTLCEEKRLLKPDFIKIDVEGYEYAVFKGGKRTLASEDAPDILLEFVDWAEGNAGEQAGSAQQLLFDYGYKIFQFENSRNITKRLSRPLTSGASMLIATKKNKFN
jgi:FkbM family methyltransferase